ncbi:MAG: AMP-binding protein [Terriglobales bacterium]
MRTSLLDSLDDFERWGDECAYVFPRGYRRERWAYRRVCELAYQVARELQARNIPKGDAVLLWSENCAEWVAAFLGCALCGVLAVPVDDAASPDFALRVSAQIRTRLALCPRERAAFLAGIETIAPADLAAIVAERARERFRPAEIQPSDPLEIVFTSGTTAEPKGVVLTHANVMGNLLPIEAEIGKYRKYERLVHPIRFLNLLPLSHVFGQFLGIFLPPLLGATVVFADNFNPTAILATIRRERVSVLVAVPRMIASLQQKVERDRDDAGAGEKFAARYAAAESQHFLRRWWTFRDIHRQFGWKFWALISGGAALHGDTEQFWHRLGYAVIQGYGLTETTSLISLNHPFHTSRGSIGKVLPGRELKLAADGEILVRGGGVASAYWQAGEPQEVAQKEDAGWFRTGDLGAIDEQGHLFFRGRKKEVIVTSAGMNIYPEDLEAALRRQPEVRDCVVLGLERGGNAEACAVVILRDRTPAASSAAAHSLVERANDTLAEYQHMRSWFVWPDEDFPRSSTQKPQRNLIRSAIETALAAQGATASGTGMPFSRPLSELFARITGRAAPRLSPETSLEDGLGLSSLDRVELLGALEDRYQIDLSETRFANTATVGDLEELLKERIAAGRPDASASRPHAFAWQPFHYPRWTLRWPTTWCRLAAQYLLARPAMLILAWPRVTGRENLRAVRGPLLVISNHLADVDIGFIQAALPARFRHRLATATGGEALEALHSPASDRKGLVRIYDRLRWAFGVALLNLFPLPRQSGFRKSFAYAGEAVDRGYSVLVFPEGVQSKDGKLGPFRAGIGLLALNLQIPVLPMRIEGLFEIKNAGKRFAAPGKIQVHIGKPVRFDAETNPEEIARALQTAVEKLTT